MDRSETVTLDQKITIKGALAHYGIEGKPLIAATAKSLVHYWYMVSNRPVVSLWRKT